MSTPDSTLIALDLTAFLVVDGLPDARKRAVLGLRTGQERRSARGLGDWSPSDRASQRPS